ncbi:MAG: DUF2381 family protein [Hyalangium sp.]|uniref:DUF2381 family protein n=1 Tax=Hyalangium sp. TaxID=2028555 RepID=UPI00389A2029
MSVSATVALVLILGGTGAQTQPAPARERRERSVTLSGTPLEVHVAQGIRTVFLFGVPVRGKAVEVDRGRIQIVDSGERSIIIQPLSEPQAGERWTMRVPLAEGTSFELAEFTLVATPAEVDTEIDVAVSERRDAGCQAACAPCAAAMGPVDAVISGLIDQEGIRTATFTDFTETERGFKSHDGVSYRAWNWGLVDVKITLPPGHQAWKLTRATLMGKTGEVPVRAVKTVPDPEDPTSVRVLVAADIPPEGAGTEFTLQLHGAEGAPPFSIPTVKLPPANEGHQ